MNSISTKLTKLGVMYWERWKMISKWGLRSRVLLVEGNYFQLMCSGPILQHPPIISAPNFVHSFDISTKYFGSDKPRQVLLLALYASPELGYTIILLPPRLAFIHCIIPEIYLGFVQLTPTAKTFG